MATGSGLPLPKTGDVRTAISGVVDGDKLSSASAWSRIAQTGARLAATGDRLMELEMHQQQARHVAETENEDADFLLKKRDEHAFNPKAFEADARGYLEGKVAESPTWDAARRQKFIGGRMEATIGTILSETRTRDASLAATALDSRRQRLEIEVTSLAQAGKTNTPEYAAAVATYSGVVQTAVDTKLMPQEKADLLIDDLAGRAQGEVAAREGVAIYQEKGYEAAVDHLQKNIRDNEGLTIKGEGRRKAFNRGLEAINLQRRVDREDRVGIVQDAQDMLARIKSNQPVDPGTLNDTLNAAKRVGAWSAYRDLFVEDSVQKLMAPYRSGAVRPAEAARVVGAIRGGNFSGLKPEEMPVATQAVTQTATNLGIAPRDLAAVISYETGGTFDPSKRGGKGNNYLGLIQFGPEERAKYGVTPGMTFDQQMKSVEGYLRDRGLKPGMGIPEIYSIINAGSLDANGQPRYNLSDGNGTVRDHIGRIQRDHHAVADKFLGGQAQAPDGDVPGLPGVPFAAQIVKRAQTEFSTQMKKDWPDLQKQIAAGKEINPDDLQAVRMAAALSNDANWIREVENTATALKIGDATKDLPAAQRQAYIDNTRAQFEDGVYKIVKQQFDRQNEMLANDPVGYAIERGRGAPQPLNMADSNAFRAGLAERGRIAKTVADDQGVPLSLALRPAELQSVQAALQAADLPGKARIYSDLTAALPEDQRSLVLAKLGSKGASAMVESFAGAMYGTAPDVAESIMRGQRAIAADERFDPSKGDKKSTFNDVLDKQMPPSAFTLASRTSDTGAVSTFRAAVIARYADLSAQASDVGSVNEERMKKAVDDVTGGVLTHNGKHLIAPRRGMSQKDFDSVVHSLADTDFSGVSTLSGEPITARYVRDNAKLESVGNGRYLVQLGSDPLKPIYAFIGAGVDMARPEPFVLDLRDKQPQKLALGDAVPYPMLQ